METDIHFARLLADLPEALVCDEAFLGELAKNAKLISVKKGDYLLRGCGFEDYFFCRRIEISEIFASFPSGVQINRMIRCTLFICLG